ncbi:McrB family protein [Melioribacter sp. OK-6-Me]|uniref:McrB family protein n=1 Tax=unclassified Melioribacter TaxID=2627329 RepID=UPI003EDAA0D2
MRQNELTTELKQSYPWLNAVHDYGNLLNSIDKLIEKYKTIINEKDSLKGEAYKWKLVRNYEGLPRTDNLKNFQDDMNKIIKKSSNLIYWRNKNSIIDNLKKYPGDYMHLLDNLFNESMDLGQRLEKFKEDLEKLKANDKNLREHDESTIAFLLTLHNPSKYTFYRDQLYQAILLYMGVDNKEKVGKKYSSYLNIIDFLIENFIKHDKDLINMVSEKVQITTFEEKDYKLLAQDIIWQVLVNDEENGQLQEESNSYINSENNNQKRLPLNLILYGPPGTGKTYETVSRALSIINNKFYESRSKEDKEEFDRRLKNRQIFFTTFHQSMTYEDFIEGIKPKLSDLHASPKIDKEKSKTDRAENEGSVKYEIKDGVFKQACAIAAYYCHLKKKIGKSNKKKNKDNFIEITNDIFEKILTEFNEGKYNQAVKEKSHEAERVVLIIDEINRGNIAQIFGELITLIEEDKRLGNNEALSVVLPYSKKIFSVPANLYIIGTMNTADRSVEAMDTALRRRFVFEEIEPLYEGPKELDQIYGQYRIGDILKTINARIEKLLDKDHRIGHSYFMFSEDGNLEENLKDVFYNRIIPLLQEYFYNDYGKIGLVLGKGFIENKDDQINFASFDYPELEDYNERKLYKIQKNRDNFYEAIEELMNHNSI